MQVVRLSTLGVGFPGKNAAEKRACKDEHGDLWYVTDAVAVSESGGFWELESVASGQRARLWPYVTPGRNNEPTVGRTLELRGGR